MWLVCDLPLAHVGEQSAGLLRSSAMQRDRLLQIAFCGGAISQLQSNFPSVREQHGIPNSHSQCFFDLLLGLSVLSIYMQRPGVCVKRVNIMSPCVFLLRNFESPSG